MSVTCQLCKGRGHYYSIERGSYLPCHIPGCHPEGFDLEEHYRSYGPFNLDLREDMLEQHKIYMNSLSDAVKEAFKPYIGHRQTGPEMLHAIAETLGKLCDRHAPPGPPELTITEDLDKPGLMHLTVTGQLAQDLARAGVFEGIEGVTTTYET